MYTVFALGVTSFALCMLLTPLCRSLALRFGLVDQPDSDRKLHEGAIPRIGGVPIALAYAGSLVFVLLFTPASERLHIRHLDLLWYLLPATGIIFLTGLLDDLIGLTPWQKLLGQLTGASVATLMGFSSTLSHSGFVDHHSLLGSPWIKMPLCILWLVICTNAVNLIDGLDGLASGVGLIATVTTLLAAIFPSPDVCWPSFTTTSVLRRSFWVIAEASRSGSCSAVSLLCGRSRMALRSVWRVR